MVLPPTPILLELERRQEGYYLSLQLLWFFECFWSNMRGLKAVPKGGGVGTVMTCCFPGRGARQWHWGLGGHLINSQKAPHAKPTPHWSLKFKADPTAQASKATCPEITQHPFYLGS